VPKVVLVTRTVSRRNLLRSETILVMVILSRAARTTLDLCVHMLQVLLATALAMSMPHAIRKVSYFLLH
jgi:hypothetical protein